MIEKISGQLSENVKKIKNTKEELKDIIRLIFFFLKMNGFCLTYRPWQLGNYIRASGKNIWNKKKTERRIKCITCTYF